MAKTLLIFVIIAAVMYPLVMRWLAVSAHPTRLKMAELGQELLRSEKLTTAQKSIISSMLRDAFEWRFMVFASLCVPAFVWHVLTRKTIANPFAELHVDDARQVNKLTSYYLRSTAAANPLFFAITLAEFAILVLPMLAINRLIGDGLISMKEIARTLTAVTEDHAQQSQNYIISPVRH